MNTFIPVENGDTLAALRGFLRGLLESDFLDALYVLMESDEGALLPALISQPALLERASPFAPVMPINGARAVAALTGKGTPARIGAVLRPCEIRALVELVKLQQASFESLVIIGMDCPGTFEVKQYVDRYRKAGPAIEDWISAAATGTLESEERIALRPACAICDRPVPERADIHLQFFGADYSRGLPVKLRDEIAAGIHGLQQDEPDGEARAGVLEALMARRTQKREAELTAMQEKLASGAGMQALFASCLRCHNCMTVCPICYCKTCLFKTAAFDHPPDFYMKVARRKGACRMPGDTLLFQLTRLHHMSTSCVSCGMCTSACPVDIPIGAIFSAVASKVQSAFDYVAGRDPDEPLPLVSFQTDEWVTVGE